MQLDLAKICSLATRLVKGRTDLALSEVSDLANIAYQDVCVAAHYDGRESLAISSTTSGENRVALPTDFGYAIALSNLSVRGPGASLAQRPASDFDSLSTIVGLPTKFAPYASWLELHPSPDSAYSLELRYYTTVPTMVASTATPVIDSRFHMAIVYKTAVLVAQARDELEAEAFNQARYLSAMGSIPSDVALRQRAKAGMHVSLKWKGSA